MDKNQIKELYKLYIDGNLSNEEMARICIEYTDEVPYKSDEWFERDNLIGRILDRHVPVYKAWSKQMRNF